MPSTKSAKRECRLVTSAIKQIPLPHRSTTFWRRAGANSSITSLPLPNGTLNLTRNAFAKVYKNKTLFTKVVYQILHLNYFDKRKAFRLTTGDVLVSAQSDRLLASEISDLKDHMNKVSTEPIRYARAKGVTKKDFNPHVL